MPSFRSLRPEDIESKDTPGDPDDLVTIVDKAAERYLIDALGDVVPGAVFIGEEGVAENPSLLASLSAARACMAHRSDRRHQEFRPGPSRFRRHARARSIGTHARVVDGGAGSVTIRLHGRCRARRRHADRRQEDRTGTADAVDAAGHGAHPHDARRVRPRRGPQAPQPLRADASTGAAATEYSAIVRGEKDFVIYYRLLPWDHAPGTLAVTEAGGAAVHLDGSQYAPLSPNQVTIVAATPELAERIRTWLAEKRSTGDQEFKRNSL